MARTFLRQKNDRFFWIVTTDDGRMLARSAGTYATKREAMEIARNQGEVVVDECPAPKLKSAQCPDCRRDLRPRRMEIQLFPCVRGCFLRFSHLRRPRHHLVFWSDQSREWTMNYQEAVRFEMGPEALSYLTSHRETTETALLVS